MSYRDGFGGRVAVRPPAAPILPSLFEVSKPIIGVIHLLPLPGSPGYKGSGIRSVIRRALNDAELLVAGGVDGLLVENAGDVPYLTDQLIDYETVAAFSVITEHVIGAVDVAVGVILLSNAVEAALASAVATGAQFVRANQWTGAYVADAGIVETSAARVLRRRTALRAESVALFADVHVKHGAHAISADRSVSQLALDAEFFGADVLIASGSRTGDPTERTEIEAVRSESTLESLVGSGLNPGNARELLSVADGAIVGAYFREGGHWWEPVSQSRVEELMITVEEFRNQLESGRPEDEDNG